LCSFGNAARAAKGPISAAKLWGFARWLGLGIACGFNLIWIVVVDTPISSRAPMLYLKLADK